MRLGESGSVTVYLGVHVSGSPSVSPNFSRGSCALPDPPSAMPRSAVQADQRGGYDFGVQRRRRRRGRLLGSPAAPPENFLAIILPSCAFPVTYSRLGRPADLWRRRLAPLGSRLPSAAFSATGRIFPICIGATNWNSAKNRNSDLRGSIAARVPAKHPPSAPPHTPSGKLTQFIQSD